MQVRSFSVASITGDPVDASYPCAFVQERPAGASLLFRRLARRGNDFLDGVAEIRDVLEASIDGREADVGDLVQLVELLHHHLADLPRADLTLAQAQDALGDPADGLVDVLGGNRALVQGALETGPDAL